jgi:hypothetical protein
METQLDGVATPFGPLRMSLRADKTGKHATLKVQPLADNCRALLVHLPGGGTARLDPHRRNTLSFDLP